MAIYPASMLGVIYVETNPFLSLRCIASIRTFRLAPFSPIVDNNVLNRFNLASSRLEVEGVEGVEGSVEKHGGRFLNEAYLRRTYLRGRLHVLAGKEAVHCRDGCSALQGRMQCTAGAVAVHCV